MSGVGLMDEAPKKKKTEESGGLFELPGFFSDADGMEAELAAKWKAEFGTEPVEVRKLGTAKHILTHMEVHAHLFAVVAPYPVQTSFYQELGWASAKDASRLSSLSRKLFRIGYGHVQVSLFGGGSK